MSFGLRRTKRDLLLALGAIWLLFEVPGIWGQQSPDVSPLPAEIRILADATPKTATVGDPIQIKVRGTSLAIRRSEARTLIIEEDTDVCAANRHRHGRKSE